MHISLLVTLYILSCSMLLSAPASAEVELTFDIGMQSDYLRWNISGSNDTPNILSELTFRSLSPIGHLTLHSRSEKTPLWLTLQYGRGDMIDNKIKDQDFAFSNRQGLFSYSEHEASGHDVQSAYLRLGYGRPAKKALSIYPTIGVQWQSARWNMRGGRRLFCRDDITVLIDPCGSPPDYAAKGLNSTYQAEWLAFSVGALLQYRLRKQPISFIIDTNLFPYARYKGKGIWNLRWQHFEQDPSFMHTGNGLGAGVITQIQWQLDQNWQLGLGWRGQFFYLRNGTDYSFLNEAGRQYYKKEQEQRTRLREVIHSTHFLFLNLTYRWR